MTELQASAVVDAINRMFESNTFSICKVDDCMKVTGAVRTPDYAALSLYHCVDYSKMSRETKDFLFRATMENICNVDDFPAVKMIRKSDIIESAVRVERKPSFFGKLLGVKIQ